MQGANIILSTLAKEGFQAFIVGGAVRDILLGMTPKDVDIVTNAHPEVVIACMNRAGYACTDLVGKAFGVVVVSTPWGHYEVATFRSEQYGTDSHRPESIRYADTLEEDVSRRDFTVNGLAMDRQGKIYDYVGGQRDIKRKRLRTIGDAAIRFQEDALRLFRACRFVGQLGFEADRDVLRAMPQAFPRVQGLSLERVKQEVERLLLTPFVAKGMDILVRSGLAEQSCSQLRQKEVVSIPILPELSHLVDLPQERAFHAHDGWMHTLVALQHTPSNLVVRWATLLHDVAKGLPEVRALRKGRLTDYGHDERGAEISFALLRRWGYNESFAQEVSWLVRNHMKFHYFAQHEEADATKWMRKEARSGRYRVTADLVQSCQSLAALCKGDVIGCGKAYSSTDGTEAFGDCLMAIAKAMPIHTRDLAYSPALITLGGHKVGAMLRTLLTQVQNGTLENSPDALLQAGRRWMKRQ